MDDQSVTVPGQTGYEWSLRASVTEGGGVRVYCRNQAFSAQGQASFHDSGASPCALEYLLGALAADVVAGFGAQAARAGVRVYQAEVRLSGRHRSPLALLGVVGEEGGAELSSVRGSLYVSSPAKEEELQQLFRAALEHAPVVRTLMRACPVDIELKPVP